MRRNLKYAFSKSFRLLLVVTSTAVLPLSTHASAIQSVLKSEETSTEKSPQTTPESAAAADRPTESPASSTIAASATDADTGSVSEKCQEQLRTMPHSDRISNMAQICGQARRLDLCSSVKNQPIYHFDRAGDPTVKASQKILVFSLTHGDEEQSGSVALSWLSRLQEIQPRNHWRVIPILNPDGWKTRTRTNANGVDVNRNFPSKDWDELALKYWKTKARAAERRFPGNQGASEPETRCAIAHIDEFRPDFVISIHTPLGVLDFDGPKVAMPKFAPLPWVSLGNFPGSLGRYMWVDRKVPVMTVELKSQKLAAKQLEQFDRLQDISGTVALQAEKALKKKAAISDEARADVSQDKSQTN